MKPIIEVNNLAKIYNYGDREPYYSLRDAISNLSPTSFIKSATKKKKTKEFWALKDISLQINEGEILGIVGPNGAGKSTLLKILSRITQPTKGTVILRGRVGSLLEVGTGFHPELTGRENVYLNGAILGMTTKEIKSKFDEIVNFSELEKFIDTPVKKYSSGMYVRLAFSVAAHLEPEILLIDEVLAVGDAKFQRKCLGKMDEVSRKSKRTVIFVSHDLGAVKNLCKMTALIDGGRLKAFGPTSKIIDKYMEKVHKEVNEKNSLLKISNRLGNGDVRINKVRISNSENKNANFAVSGEQLTFIFDYKAYKKYKKVNLSFSIHSLLGQNIILIQSKYTNDYFDVNKGSGTIQYTINELPLISGQYLIYFRMDKQGVELDYPKDPAYKLKVIDGDFYGTGAIPLQHSPVLVRGQWSIK